jgi:hypothetical protein
MRTLNHRTVSNLVMVCLVSLGLAMTACNPSAQMLNKVPVNSMEVKVVDQNDEPIAGAQVNVSNGRKSTTDENGVAKVRFGSVGIHSVTILADNHLPNNFIVTMPTDRGKMVTRRLADEIDLSGIAFNSINMYPLIFNYLFSSYGYGLELSDYGETEFTSWKISMDDEEDALYMEKAFLKELANGQEWWQIVLNSDEEESNYTAEILFSEDRSSIVRYREQIGDGDIREKPVAEGWYSEPAKLTDESMESALEEKNVSVEIPKGTYTADLLTFGTSEEVALNIWRAVDESIPGGVLKYENVGDEGERYQSILQDFGTGAESRLESF